MSFGRSCRADSKRCARLLELVLVEQRLAGDHTSRRAARAAPSARSAPASRRSVSAVALASCLASRYAPPSSAASSMLPGFALYAPASFSIASARFGFGAGRRRRQAAIRLAEPDRELDLLARLVRLEQLLGAQVLVERVAPVAIVEVRVAEQHVAARLGLAQAGELVGRRARLLRLLAREVRACARLNQTEPDASMRFGSWITRSQTLIAWSHRPRPVYAAHRPFSALTIAFGFLPSLRCDDTRTDRPPSCRALGAVVVAVAEHDARVREVRKAEPDARQHVAAFELGRRFGEVRLERGRGLHRSRAARSTRRSASGS